MASLRKRGALGWWVPRLLPLLRALPLNLIEAAKGGASPQLGVTPCGRSLSELSHYLANFNDWRSSSADVNHYVRGDTSDASDVSDVSGSLDGIDYLDVSRDCLDDTSIASDEFANCRRNPSSHHLRRGPSVHFNRGEELTSEGDPQECQECRDCRDCQDCREYQFVFSNDGKLPYGCTQENISKRLTDQEIISLTAQHFFYISGREAFLVFFYYIVYLTRTYRRMVNELNDWFRGMALSRGIPNELRNKFWGECKADLIKDLKGLQKVSKTYYHKIVHGQTFVFVVSFHYLLLRCAMMWKRARKVNGSKWADLLRQRVLDYSAG
ncbi:Plasmodium exported protein (PHIST), unknown function [Plasmodium vivax]|uniref:Plasmodium RESA N-terminal domain-containing protein n=1 Tax=Plasmodium vivax TaxID=5855 RepID=A0A564ZQN6_PLAVI|nr:Plasmodium exported protein (PHIST), unknown function [Plasmodium vivax]